MAIPSAPVAPNRISATPAPRAKSSSDNLNETSLYWLGLLVPLGAIVGYCFYFFCVLKTPKTDASPSLTVTQKQPEETDNAMDQESLSEWEDWNSLMQEPPPNSKEELDSQRFKTSSPLKDTIGLLPGSTYQCQSMSTQNDLPHPAPMATAIMINSEEDCEKGQPEYKLSF
jgi:hypothetical protein